MSKTLEITPNIYFDALLCQFRLMPDAVSGVSQLSFIENEGDAHLWLHMLVCDAFDKAQATGNYNPKSIGKGSHSAYFRSLMRSSLSVDDRVELVADTLKKHSYIKDAIESIDSCVLRYLI